MPPSDPRVGNSTLEQIDAWWIADQIEAFAAARKQPIEQLSIDAIFDLTPESSPDPFSSDLPSEEARIMALYDQILEENPLLDIADAYERACALVKKA